MHQLQYHYEKELNRGARPAFCLITAQDASAGLHMILCVSGITWSEGGIGDDGLSLVPHPTLEFTDGWYRLRTQVDEVLAHAARRGVIRVGRKISVSSASLPRNTEPREVLEACDKVELNIAGKGTHLGPWHAKLGFQPRPAIATIHSLLPDGRFLPCLELVVTKVYSVAVIEFGKDSDGKVTREGPRREKEELAAQDAWARKRESECQRLRMEVKSGGDWHPGDDDDMPEHIESMFDDCEYVSDASLVLRRVSKSEASWLARFARERAQQERETVELGLEQELQSLCPPREAMPTRREDLRIVQSNSRCGMCSHYRPTKRPGDSLRRASSSRLQIYFRRRRMRRWIATSKARMYMSARARPHDGSNSHHDGASLLHRGANGCTSIGSYVRSIILFPCLCATAIWLGVVSSTY